MTLNFEFCTIKPRIYPGYATESFPERRIQLDRLKRDGYTLYELDCSIAAEVIMFYKPEVYLAGWQSTTFESVESQEKACAIYSTKYEDSNTNLNNYKELMDMFFSRLNSGVSDYQGIALDETHTYYLIAYNNIEKYLNQVLNYNKHEIAIYDATTGLFTYYKLNGEEYKVVTVDGDPV